MPSIQSRLLNGLLRSLMRPRINEKTSATEVRDRIERLGGLLSKPWPHQTVSKTELGGVPCDYLEQPGAHPARTLLYLHGGGSGYFDDTGIYRAVGAQDENTWNHEETFDDLYIGQVQRVDAHITADVQALGLGTRQPLYIALGFLCRQNPFIDTGSQCPEVHTYLCQ